MTNLPVLSIILFTPLLGILPLFIIDKIFSSKDNSKLVFLTSLGFSLMSFLFSVFLLANFDKKVGLYQFAEILQIFGRKSEVSYHIGVDGISVLMVVLTTFLMPLCIISGKISIKKDYARFNMYLLLLEFGILGAFLSVNIILFYIFFELILLPMFLMIGIWGSENRVYASFKFFIYTLFGSVFFLISIIYIYVSIPNSVSSIAELADFTQNFPLDVQKWLWIGFFMSFAIKVPMFLFHTWLPDAHVQAPTTGSMILAGILIKLGAYGFLRFSIPMLPDASVYFTNFIFVMSVIAIIYTSIIALVQEDMKKMIAYSSVAHMGFVTMGIFSGNISGIKGAVMQMISHGLISVGLFFCVGVLYDRVHSKKIADFGGIAKKMPNYAIFFMILMMGSVGLPGTSGFVGELLTILGAFQVNHVIAIFAATGMVLGASYMLYLYARVIFGEENTKISSKIYDVNKLEFLILLILVSFVIVIGLYPEFIFQFLSETIENFVSRYSFHLIAL